MTRLLLMQSPARADGGASARRLLQLLCLLWLAGMAMRVTIQAVPPVIPLIRDDLSMTETGRPGDVHRMSAGMFTISYGCAVVVPIVCGALWDLTGRPWAAFVPLGLCAVALTVIGLALSLHRPAAKTS